MSLTQPSPTEDSLVSRVLAAGYSSLKFPEPLESEFRHDHLVAQRRWVRMSLLIVIGTSTGFGLIDHLIIRAANSVPDFIRFGLQLPVLLILVLATIKRFYMSWYQIAMQIGGPLFGTGTIVMAIYALPQHTALVGARLMLVTFFFYFMAGLRMHQALRGNLIILGLLIAAGMLELIATDVATYLTFSLVCANVIGTAGSYAL